MNGFKNAAEDWEILQNEKEEGEVDDGKMELDEDVEIVEDENIIFSEGDKQFLKDNEEKMMKQQESDEFKLKLASALREFVESFNKKSFEIVDNLSRKLHNSILVAVNPIITRSIDEQDKKYASLSKIEAVIYKNAFNWTTNKLDDGITIESIRKFLNDNNYIKLLIKLAYKKYYDIQKRLSEYNENNINENLQIRFIIFVLCKDEMDYTDMDTSNLQDLIDECTNIQETNPLDAIDNSPRFAVPGEGPSYRKNPYGVIDDPTYGGRGGSSKRKTKKQHKKSKRNHKSKKSKTNKKAKRSKRKH